MQHAVPTKASPTCTCIGSSVLFFGLENRTHANLSSCTSAGLDTPDIALVLKYPSYIGFATPFGDLLNGKQPHMLCAFCTLVVCLHGGDMFHCYAHTHTHTHTHTHIATEVSSWFSTKHMACFECVLLQVYSCSQTAHAARCMQSYAAQAYAALHWLMQPYSGTTLEC